MNILMRRHMPFYLAAVAAVVCAVVLAPLRPDLTWSASANAFYVTYMLLALTVLPALTAEFLRKHAARSDVPVAIIVLICIAVVAASVTSLFITMNGSGSRDVANLVLSLAAVPLGWLTIHMVFSTHYAHLYWQPDFGQDATGEKSTKKAKRGLAFPETPDPSGLDFVYFSYVIGMTGQTSDVAVTTRAMRRVTLVHSVLSFFFNTVLVAAAVNAAVTLGG